MLAFRHLIDIKQTGIGPYHMLVLITMPALTPVQRRQRPTALALALVDPSLTMVMAMAMTMVVRIPRQATTVMTPMVLMPLLPLPILPPAVTTTIPIPIPSPPSPTMRHPVVSSTSLPACSVRPPIRNPTPVWPSPPL